MFNGRYFASRYFARRYWPKVGAELLAVLGDIVTLAPSYFRRTVTTAISSIRRTVTTAPSER